MGGRRLLPSCPRQRGASLSPWYVWTVYVALRLSLFSLCCRSLLCSLLARYSPGRWPGESRIWFCFWLFTYVHVQKKKKKKKKKEKGGVKKKKKKKKKKK